MTDFEYKVSIIIPVYNVSEYISRCLDSLLTQTISQDKMQVILVDDGSTDDSLEICRTYESFNNNFFVYSKENEGVSKARNYAIKRATGQYIMYLDSDDYLSSNTVKSVVDFFDQHYDEVDMVTYPEQAYDENGNKMWKHFRYNYLNKTGVYDLDEYVFVTQVRLNIAVKNLNSDNLLFDEEMGYHEDQKYCSEILKEKKKLGFVDKCEYCYVRHAESITGEHSNPIYLFDMTTTYWENLFDSFGDEVPHYYQALFVHDLNWKLSQNILWPYHYSPEEFQNAVMRIKKLLSKVDNEIILKVPNMDNFHRYYWLEMKPNNNITPVVSDEGISLYDACECIFIKKRIEIIFNKLKTKNGKMLMQATVKSQYFNFVPDFKIYAIENNDYKNKKLIPSFFSNTNYYKCKTATNKFRGFYYECDMSEVESVEFEIEVDGFAVKTSYYLMPTCPFSTKYKIFDIIRENKKISLKDNIIKISDVNSYEAEGIRSKNDNNIKAVSFNSYKLRKMAEAPVESKIWIYYDCKGVNYDNGYYQFIHDFDKNDGIERYYILNNDFEASKQYFEEKHLPYIVMFGSNKHQILFLQAEKLITAYIEEVNIYPFDATKKEQFMDIMNCEIVYLQHGILHATLPWKYTPERIEIDKVVASSQFEIRNFTGKYCFRNQDVLPCGMPRFDHISRESKSENRILFAPSWRFYLIGKCINTVWQLQDDVFKKSEYFELFNEFLNSPELEELLEKHDMYLDFKIHPIFVPYVKYFDIKNKRVSVAENTIRDEDYSVFITDFSSFSFDFVYLRKPIIYFVPDYIKFKAGLNQYRELDLPFEEAFGELVLTPEKAVEALAKILDNNCKSETIYQNREEDFFLPMENCSEQIYNRLIRK